MRVAVSIAMFLITAVRQSVKQTRGEEPCALSTIPACTAAATHWPRHKSRPVCDFITKNIDDQFMLFWKHILFDIWENSRIKAQSELFN